ncbi:MAG: RepB family DNA primase, partial [Actinobacteria bacterium]|nr:RepB family DNA primase [Actinomycetota bacterium]
KKTNLCQVRVLWVDLDRADDDPLGTIELLGLPPASMIMSTGAGFHDYWLLDEPLDLRLPENIERVEAINRGLVHALGGDKAAIDASRVLRPPGTVNFPNAAKRKKGRTAVAVRLVRTMI